MGTLAPRVNLSSLYSIRLLFRATESRLEEPEGARLSLQPRSWQSRNESSPEAAAVAGIYNTGELALPGRIAISLNRKRIELFIGPSIFMKVPPTRAKGCSCTFP